MCAVDSLICYMGSWGDSGSHVRATGRPASGNARALISVPRRGASRRSGFSWNRIWNLLNLFNLLNLLNLDLRSIEVIKLIKLAVNNCVKVLHHEGPTSRTPATRMRESKQLSAVCTTSERVIIIKRVLIILYTSLSPYIYIYIYIYIYNSYYIYIYIYIYAVWL